MAAIKACWESIGENTALASPVRDYARTEAARIVTQPIGPTAYALALAEIESGIARRAGFLH